MVFHRSLSDSKSSKVCRTLLSILINLNNTVTWMVSTCPLIFPVSLPIFWRLFQMLQQQLVSPPPSCSIAFLVLYSSLFSISFYFTLTRLKYLFLFFSFSLIFTLWSAETAKFILWQLLFFC